ncbi:MAG: glycosyltransferase [Ignavibacteriaceae bacterium]
MKIALLTILYKNSVSRIYDSRPELAMSSYSKQKQIVDKEASIWASGWEDALIKNNHEVFTIPINVLPMQQKWAKEQNVKLSSEADIAFQQIKQFNPDVIWYDYFDVQLLKKIKSEVKSIKLVLGWTGSAIVDYNILKETDLVLSCAPEAVEELKKSGIKAAHLNHAFNFSILEKLDLDKIAKGIDFIFIGQIFRGANLHNKREKLLSDLITNTDLKIYSPIFDFNHKTILKSIIKRAGYYLTAPLGNTTLSKDLLLKNEFFKEFRRSKNSPILPYKFGLKRKVFPPVYGAQMYSVIKNAGVVLNIHSDSSTKYASNMRLFETTGVGTCLLTDWKENLNNLFKDGSEIISYKSTEECVEKAGWLLNHREESLQIGKRAQKKTLTQHTYEQRAPELLSIIKKSLK